jgi:hypothetical protein
MRKRKPTEEVKEVSAGTWQSLLAAVMPTAEQLTPSDVYLTLITEGLRRHWDLTPVSFADVVAALRGRRYEADAASGRFRKI